MRPRLDGLRTLGAVTRGVHWVEVEHVIGSAGDDRHKVVKVPRHVGVDGLVTPRAIDPDTRIEDLLPRAALTRPLAGPPLTPFQPARGGGL